MELLSPQITSDPRGRLRISHTQQFEYIDPQTELVVIRSVNTLNWSEKKLETLDEWVESPPIIPIVLQQAWEYIVIQNVIQVCVTNAEVVNDALLRLLRTVFQDKHKHTELNKLDFMKRRDILSDVLKQEKHIVDIEELNTVARIKNFTRLFNQFIVDRNIYTHGSLHLKVPDGKYVIKYLKGNEEVYAYLSLETVQSFIDAYQYFSAIINKLIRFYNDQNLRKFS